MPKHNFCKAPTQKLTGYPGEYNFDMDDRPRASHQVINSLEELKQLVEKACSMSPHLPMLMLNQILDCLTMLGMDDQFQQHTLKAKENQ